MKKLFLFVFAAIAFVACTQNDVEELSSNRVYLPDEISVGFENNDETRVQLYEGKSVWNAGDLVSVFYKTLDNLMWEFQGEDGDRTGLLKMIEGSVGKQKMSEVVVVYPYNQDYILAINNRSVEAKMPAKQEYRYESYDPVCNLMIATSEGRDFVLKNTCGWLKIELTGDGQQVEKLTLRGNNGETVAGDVTIDWDSSKATFISNGTTDPNDTEVGGSIVFDDASYDKLELNCHRAVLSSEPTAFYFTLPEQRFVDGITVEVKCRGYEPMVLSTDDAVEIKRNHIKPMATVEFEAEEGEGSEIPNNEIWYTATEQIWPNYEWDSGITLINNYYDDSTGEGILEFDGELTTIGYQAFAYCGSLTSITIPDSVTTIEGAAFNNCSSLISITIGDSVTTIGDDAFFYCESLTSVTIPDSVTTIGYAAFNNCSNLTSVTIGDSVTTIGEYAFECCRSLTSITIPDSVTTIGKRAFAYCPSLTEFNGKFASEDGRCLIVDGTLNSFAPAGLTSYTIPDSVTTIGERAFGSCSSLTSVTIPDSVTTIEYAAFTYCTNLVEFNGKFASEDGRCLIVDGTLNSFAPAGLTSYTIPDSVTTIGGYAFCDCYSLTSVTIPDSVTTIGVDAFYFCLSLTSITIPDSVTTIEDGAFAYCYSLTSVYCKATTPPSLGSNVFDANASGRKIYVPAASVEAYKTADYWSDYADAIVGYDFENGVVVEPEVSINNEIHYTATAKVEANSNYPWTFDTFGANIVSNEWDSESGKGVITFDADVTTIGNDAFIYCYSLTSVTIPDSVTTIGQRAFANCTNLLEFNGKFVSEDGRCLIVDGTLKSFAPAGLTSYTIPDSVTTIGNYALAYCSSLTSVTIGDSVTTIGYAAFAYCYNLTSITIPDSVTTIEVAAFACCESLTEFNGKFASEDGRCLIVDGTLKSFAPAGLTSYTIPDGVTTIGAEAFSDCYSLTSVTIPDSVTTIGMGAFYGCSSLTNITIPDSVTTIGNVAFTFCDSLTNITIPDSVTTIGDYAFYDCYSLTSVYCEATTPPSLGGSNVFDANALGRTIYVPTASVEAYKTADYWSEYADYIVGYDFENPDNNPIFRISNLVVSYSDFTLDVKPLKGEKSFWTYYIWTKENYEEVLNNEAQANIVQRSYWALNNLGLDAGFDFGTFIKEYMGQTGTLQISAYEPLENDTEYVVVLFYMDPEASDPTDVYDYNYVAVEFKTLTPSAEDYATLEVGSPIIESADNKYNIHFNVKTDEKAVDIKVGAQLWANYDFAKYWDENDWSQIQIFFLFRTSVSAESLAAAKTADGATIAFNDVDKDDYVFFFEALTEHNTPTQYAIRVTPEMFE